MICSRDEKWSAWKYLQEKLALGQIWKLCVNGGRKLAETPRTRSGVSQITRQPKMIETNGWSCWTEETLCYSISQNLIGRVIDQSGDFSIEILKIMLWVHFMCDWDWWNFRTIQKPFLFQTSYSWAFPLAPLRRYRSFKKIRKLLHFQPNQPIPHNRVGIRPYWVDWWCLFSV